MVSRYQVTELIFKSGERFPLLRARKGGVPQFKPTAYLCSELRSSGRATRTLTHASHGVMVGLQCLEYLGVDLEERMSEGRLFDLGEVEELVRFFRLTQKVIDGLNCIDSSAANADVAAVTKKRPQLARLKASAYVADGTAGNRLRYFRNYLAWLVRGKLLSIRHGNPLFLQLQTTSEEVFTALTERIPSEQGRNDVGRRQGLSQEHIERMLAVIKPDSPENPWKNQHVRIRNQLIVLWFYQLGLRLGELLILRLSDINLRANEVLVPRRADDKVETRKDAPNTKTKDRLLVLGDELAELTRQYIMGPRKNIAGAKRHPFFIVATGKGKPLSKVAVGKMFIQLRRKVLGLPEELSAHVLRFTWNDDFSTLMDERKVEPAEEELLRKQQMGWSDRSKMAARYTHRHIVRKANEASLAMQAKTAARRFADKGAFHE